MSEIFFEAIFILLLIAANGLFAMSELAVVSARKSLLMQWAEGGNRKARAALKLAEDPNRFLSTVQVGITVVGTLAAVLGGATIAENLVEQLTYFPSLAPYAEGIALGVVVVGISYFSLVLGELVPKRLAMSNPEGIALAAAGPLHTLGLIAGPVVSLLGLSTDTVLRLFRFTPSSAQPVSEEEVKILLKEGTQAGVFEPAEHDMLKRVLRLADQRVTGLMTPALDVAWIDLTDSPADVRRKVDESPHSRFPLCEGSLDFVVGVVHVRDLLQGESNEHLVARQELARPPLFIYEGMSGLKVLEMFKSSSMPMAIVLSEYGSVEGLVTLYDILTALVGDIPSETEAGDSPATQRADGSWLIDGALPMDDLRDILAIEEDAERDYYTVGGLVLTELGRIPSVADSFQWAGLRFEVIDMDGNRVDKVLVSPLYKASRKLSSLEGDDV